MKYKLIKILKLNIFFKIKPIIFYIYSYFYLILNRTRFFTFVSLSTCIHKIPCSIIF